MWTELKERLATKNSLVLKIKARPSVAVTQTKSILADGTIKIDIAAAPEKNKANQELIKFLAAQFVVNKNKITIISGQSDANKLVKISK